MFNPHALTYEFFCLSSFSGDGILQYEELHGRIIGRFLNAIFYIRRFGRLLLPQEYKQVGIEYIGKMHQL